MKNLQSSPMHQKKKADILSGLAKRKRSLPIKFSKRQQERIKEKYENRCAFCCRSVEDGVDICVVHKTALVDGGKATIKNGQVLCRECNSVRYDNVMPKHKLIEDKKFIVVYYMH